MNVADVLQDAKLYYDDEGEPIIELTTCGNCGRSWNNAASTSITPTHGPRCPWEMDDEHPCWEFGENND